MNGARVVILDHTAQAPMTKYLRYLTVVGVYGIMCIVVKEPQKEEKNYMNKFVIASLNRKGNLVFVNRYYGGTAKTSKNIEDAKIYYSPYDAQEEWKDRMGNAKLTLGLKDGNIPFITSMNQIMNKTI